MLETNDPQAHLAVRRHGHRLLSGAQTEQRPADRRLVGNETLRGLGLNSPNDGVALLFTFDVDHDSRADANLVTALACILIDDHSLTKEGIEIGDSLLCHCLIVFCRVVPGVLTQIAVRSRLCKRRHDRRTADLFELLELRAQSLETFTGYGNLFRRHLSSPKESALRVFMNQSPGRSTRALPACTR